MLERLISDARTIGAAAVAVVESEWGGWYVAILGGRVSQVFATQDEAQTAANGFIAQVVA